ncbi:MAG TPA: hypothetical protein VHB97_22000 [Polyangia bacterium]|jgi:hypothetical protein|nr:hypothetical protein [Polyangia bacterium]
MSEDAHGDQETGEAAELLRGARMPDPPSAVKERIRRALAERPARRARFAAWRPVFVAIGLLLASAAVASTWMILRQLRKSDASERSRVAPAVEPAPANAAPAVPVPVTVPVPVPVMEPAPRASTRMREEPPAQSAPPKALRSRPAAKRIVAQPARLSAAAPRASSEEIIRLLQPSSRAPSPPATASPPEAELVLDATLALRRAHEPRRSLDLLKQYLTRYPHGALIEESMALAMEAMATLDDASAARVAADYLQRYPAGRFTGLARTALQRFAR